MTVTNTWNGFYLSAVNGEIPPTLAVVTEINGESTKDMSVTQFYRIVDGSSKLSIKYLQKENGKNVSKESVLTTRQNYYLVGGVAKIEPLAKPDKINIASDPDIDYFDYCTFDFKVDGEDPLMDRQILDEISEVFVGRGMKRDKQNPDLIFMIRKSLQQVTNSTYVPKTKQVVNTGSTTTMQRSLFTGKNYLLTQQHSQVITSGGYTHTGVEATFHLEFTVLKNQQFNAETDVPPMVWKLDYNVFSSSAIDIMDEAQNGISYWCLNYPFSEPKFSYKVSTSGLVFKSAETIGTGELVDVLPGTYAYEKGLRGGDKIMKVKIPAIYWFWFGSVGKRCCFAADNNQKKYHSFIWIGYFVPYIVPLPFPIFTCKNLGYNNSTKYLSYNSEYHSYAVKMTYLIPKMSLGTHTAI